MTTPRRLWIGVFLIVLVGGQLAVGMRASTRASITGDEPFYLLTTQSLLSDGDLDLRDEYANVEYERFWPDDDLWVQMAPLSDGQLLAPHEPGLSLIAIPGYALGGLEGVRRTLSVVWAAAMATGALAALMYGARPIAAGAAAIVFGLGAPGLVYSSQIYPESSAALIIALVLIVLRTPRARPVVLGALLVALVWLGSRYAAVSGLAALAAMFLWRDSRSAVLQLVAVVSIGAATFVWWHSRVFGGLTAYTTNIVWAGDDTLGILERHVQLSGRAHRLYASLLDVRFGVFRWLPISALSFWGISRKTALPVAFVATSLGIAAFSSETIMGWWFPGRLLIATFPAWIIIAAFAIDRFPRIAIALGAWSLAIAGAVAYGARTGGIRLAVDPWQIGAPLAPARLFPDFRYWEWSTVAISFTWLVTLSLIATLWIQREGRTTLWR